MTETTGATDAKRARRDRMAERVSAAAYGTVLVLPPLVLIDASQVASGLGWELVTGVGIATWLAHLYAEVMGDHLRHSSPLDRRELGRAVVDGLPILLAAVPPAVILLLGRLDVLDAGTALWVAIVVAFLQLVAVGAIAGSAVSGGAHFSWRYAVAAAGVGIIVVSLKLVLRH